jgi:hypothetical protein
VSHTADDAATVDELEAEELEDQTLDDDVPSEEENEEEEDAEQDATANGPGRSPGGLPQASMADDKTTNEDSPLRCIVPKYRHTGWPTTSCAGEGPRRPAFT